MIKHIQLVAAVLIALSGVAFGIDSDCDFYQDVKIGATYYVYSPGYPSTYSGQKSCRWYAKSPTRVRLTCEISLPATANCVGDRLSVSLSGDLQLADAQNWCGTGIISRVSDGNYINIVLQTVAGTGGGRFLCTLQATNDNCSCGWKNLIPDIAGGTETGVNEYPMMAGLIDILPRSLYCGATIISNKHVITAAHCLNGKTASQLGVLVGDHDISTGAETNSSSLHSVSSFIVHPSYDTITQANDIAIVTVSDTIMFTMEVGPACLPFRHVSDDFQGTEVVLLGWGTTEFGGARFNTLEKVTVNVTDVSSCKASFPEVTNRQICTYTAGKDACQLDSGGPVLWQNPTTRRLVSVGVISYGQICASSNPGVNTRVAAYLDWILSETPDTAYCDLE